MGEDLRSLQMFLLYACATWMYMCVYVYLCICLSILLILHHHKNAETQVKFCVCDSVYVCVLSTDYLFLQSRCPNVFI